MTNLALARYLAFNNAQIEAFDRAGEIVCHHDYGFPLELRPGVYPSQLRLSYATQMAIDQLPEDLRGKQVLDVGTGPGPLAIEEARRGALVVACDNSASAVELAYDNTLRNNVADRVKVLKSDLFDGVTERFPGMRFDIITANLWFLPQHHRDSPRQNKHYQCCRRFLHTARDLLTPAGMAILISGSSANVADTQALLANAGITPELRKTITRYGHEQTALEWHAYLFGKDGKAPTLQPRP